MCPLRNLNLNSDRWGRCPPASLDLLRLPARRSRPAARTAINEAFSRLHKRQLVRSRRAVGCDQHQLARPKSAPGESVDDKQTCLLNGAFWTDD